MLRVLTAAVGACWIVLSGSAAAQGGPAEKLADVFQDIFGPNGLVVNSEAVLPDGSTHSAHFNSAFQSNFTQFNVALASQLTALPLPSPASGFTYKFDASTGTFTRSTQSFGPLLADRAETIGRGKISMGFNYQFFSFDSLEGQNLSHVPAVFRHDGYELGGGRADVVTTTSSVEATVGQWTGVVTYGVTDRLDVSLAVPVVQTSLRVLANATIRRLGTADAQMVHFFRDPDAPGGIGSQRQFSSGGEAAGIGDLIMRVKGTAWLKGHSGIALGADVRLPTGDERDLLGSGAMGLKPFAVASLSFGRVSPHVNLAYQWNGSSVLAGDPQTDTKDDLPDQFHYAVGADLGVNARFSLAADLLGQRIIDSPRVFVRHLEVVGPGGAITVPDLVFERGSLSVMHGAVGFKTNVAGTVLVNFNLRFKIGTGGLGDRVTPLLGLEYGF